MTFKIRHSLMLIPVLLAGAAIPAQAEDFSAAQKEALGGIIHDYVMDNPELIVEAMEKYRADEEKREREAAFNTIKDHADDLKGADLPTIGNPDGDVTIVEFFDYNCGYCKKALPDLQELVKTDGNVRVVFKEMPILGPTSQTAAQYALAAHKQGKYFEFHSALMEHRGGKDAATLEKIGKDIGLDVKQLKKDANSNAIADAVEDSRNLATKIGVRGTPAFIVGDELFRGYIGLDGMKAAVKAAREKS